MKPTEILVGEHNAIKLMLKVVGEVNKRIESGEKVEPGDLEKIVSFIQGFADACHHRKEEGLLFPAMEKAGTPHQGGPIGVMLREHEQGRSYAKKMKEAIKNIDDQKFAKQFVENAKGYIRLLEQHIYKEDNILYPMADKNIPDEEMKRLLEEFDRVEREETGEGVHEKYHHLLHKLADKYLEKK